ncbi:MAG: hypothetical protein A4E66_02000 [Syntrophus sp. PtaB.Bin001]|nr:MAG: hypothetical protein A4E66_02000 [Syntrophus sp. PtaB.Bin001]
MLDVARNGVRIARAYFAFNISDEHSIFPGDHIPALFIRMLVQRRIVPLLVKHLRHHRFRTMGKQDEINSEKASSLCFSRFDDHIVS